MDIDELIEKMYSEDTVSKVLENIAQQLMKLYK